MENLTLQQLITQTKEALARQVHPTIIREYLRL